MSGRERGTVAEISDFLLLQVVNRYEALFRHLSGLTGLHPESFCRIAVQLAAEIATFATDRRPRVFPTYKHDDLCSTFTPVIEELLSFFSKQQVRRAEPIPLHGPEAGIYGAKVPDLDLLDSADFVLAVNADVSSEFIRENFLGR